MNRLASPIAPKTLRFWHGLKGLGIALAGMFLFIFLWSVVFLWISPLPPHIALALQTAGISLMFLGGAVWAVSETANPVASVLSFKKPRFVFFIVAVVGVLFAGALCDELVSLLHRWKPDFFEMGAMAEVSKQLTESSPLGFVLVAIALSVFPAIGEEMMFRGLVFRSFKQDMPIYFAIIYSSILFGVVHFNWLQGTAAAVLGVYLAFIVHFSGSIYPAIAAHFVNNLTWCIITRYHEPFMTDVLERGHSLMVIVICGAVVALSLWVMIRLRRADSKGRLV